MADAAATSPADRALFGRIVALVEGRRRGSAAYVLPPAVCALLFLRMSPERDPGTRLLGVRSGSIVEFAARMASDDWSGVSALRFTHGHLRTASTRRLQAAAAGETFDPGPGPWTGRVASWGLSSACLGASQQIGLSSMVTRSRSLYRPGANGSMMSSATDDTDAGRGCPDRQSLRNGDR
jgi:hypothetical protein